MKGKEEQHDLNNERQNKEILSQRNKHLKGKTILFLIHYKIK
jgi:hypothetical protein